MNENGDDRIDVKLSPKEYEVLQKMIEREEAVTWLWGYLRNFVFVAAGGIVTVWAAFELLTRK